MSHNIEYYQFVKRNLEMTKICTKKCKVLENKLDDHLNEKDSKCLAFCAWHLINYREGTDSFANDASNSDPLNRVGLNRIENQAN